MAKVGYKRGIILIFASMKEFANMSFEERSSYILDTMKWVEFHKEDGIWHADIENPECECCEMVNGSEMFLDEISHGGTYVSLNVSDKIYPKARFVFQRIDHDDNGATYLILDRHPDAPGISGESLEYAGRKIWLPTSFYTFFGEYPEFISVI